MKKLTLPNGARIEFVQRIIAADNVQRIIAADNKSKGVDRFFSFDYMGSSEFEFGALSSSLRRIRELDGGKLKSQHVKFRYRGRGFPAFTLLGSQVPLVETGKEFAFTFLGPEEFVSTIRELFEIQSMNELCSLKERTEIDRAYGLNPFYRNPQHGDDLYGNIIGWWDIENDWIAFKNAKYAHLWLEGLNSK